MLLKLSPDIVNWEPLSSQLANLNMEATIKYAISYLEIFCKEVKTLVERSKSAQQI